MTHPVDDPRTPVTLLTGFLGSGKTTVLQQLLQSPGLANTAVIINEFGEVGLDHLLVDHVSDNLRVLNSGCLCCTVRGDLIDTLQMLAARRERGEIAFSRVVIETTGLVDPAPVLHTLLADPAIVPAYRLASVVATVDAVNGWTTLEHHTEAQIQVAVADTLLLTKTDLVDPGRADAFVAHLRQLNPHALLLPAKNGRVDPEILLRSCDTEAGEAAASPPGARDGHRGHHHHRHDVNRHSVHIRAHSFVFDTPVPEASFTYWLSLLASMRGPQLLRIKGLVQVAGQPDEPLVVHGAQHVIHPPRRLPRWPSDDHRTRLVFITRDLDRGDIERTFHRFVMPPPPLTRLPSDTETLP